MPEFVLALIEASVWGKTVEEAAGALACDQSDRAGELSTLTQLLDKVLKADFFRVFHVPACYPVKLSLDCR